MVDKENLQIILEMLPIQEIRKIHRERRTGIKGTKKEELVSPLLELKWTTEQFEDLKRRFRKAEKKSEKSYLAKISLVEYDLEDIKESLLQEPAQFDDEGSLLEEGYEVSIESGILKGDIWNKKIKREITDIGELRKIENTSCDSFQINRKNLVCNLQDNIEDITNDLDDSEISEDLEEKCNDLLPNNEDISVSVVENGEVWRINESLNNFDLEIKKENEKLNIYDKIEDLTYIFEDNYGKANGLVSELEHHGLEFETVGHKNLLYEDAKEKTEQFVEELKDKSEGNNLPIKEVKIFIEEGTIKRVGIEGYEDIFENEDVRHFVVDKGGKITRIEGKFQFQGRKFKFNAGYIMDSGLGRIKVEKLGQKTTNEEIIERAYTFLYNIYSDYFIDV